MEKLDLFSVPSNYIKSSVVTIGVFDGVHKGHQKLIKDLLYLSQTYNSCSIVITFSKHPKKVLKKDGPPLIMPLFKKLEILENLGVEVCLLIEFNKDISLLPPNIFLEKYLINKLKIKGIIIGENFRFGHQGKGDLNLLKEYSQRYNYKIISAPLLKTQEGEIISSSNIRKAILKGELEKAREMLGRNFTLIGKVVKGKQRGRLLGFPTANLDLYHEVIPPEGVYCGSIKLKDNIYPTLISIGKCPTFGEKEEVKIEVYILNFSENLYDKVLETEIWQKIREQKRFENKENLIKQIKKDRIWLLENYENLKQKYKK